MCAVPLAGRWPCLRVGGGRRQAGRQMGQPAGGLLGFRAGCCTVMWSRVAVACKLRRWSLPRQCERFVRQGGLLSLRRPSLGGPPVMLDGGRRSDACRLQGTRRCLLDLPGLAAGELVVYMRAMQQAVLRCQPACVLIDGR